MFEWLNNLKPGDQVTVRSYEMHGNPTEFTNVVKEITDDYILTLPNNYAPKLKQMIEPIRFFKKKFGSSNTEQLVEFTN